MDKYFLNNSVFGLKILEFCKKHILDELKKYLKNANINNESALPHKKRLIMLKKQKIIQILLIASFFVSPFLSVSAATIDDADYYQKYELHLKYEKKQKYSKYKKYSKNKKKYGFKSQSAKAQAKDSYVKYKLYKKDPIKYRAYAQYEEGYKKYSKYKKYVTPYSKYSRYSKYKKYNKSEYNEGKNYGGNVYKEAHDRYLKSQENGGLGEATLGGTALGPEISVGIYSYSKADLRDETYVRVRASKDYYIKNEDGEILATVPANIDTTDDSIGARVKYVSDGNLKVYQAISETIAGSDIYFESADGDNTDIIFDLNRPSVTYDQYRGKIKIHFYDSSEADGDLIWVINTLPLEHYVWGIGEIAGDGDVDHTRAMTVMFRTYGYWKVRWSTQYAAQGFTVVSTSSNQIYNGYDWEIDHSGIKAAAENTQGKIMMYGSEIALSPYSSWTDGRTRSFEERWNSTLYPWCRSVSDPYGKHATMSTSELEAAGNHMVGLSANGSLNLATNYDWSWEEILRYYFYATRFVKAY